MKTVFQMKELPFGELKMIGIVALILKMTAKTCYFSLLPIKICSNASALEV